MESQDLFCCWGLRAFLAGYDKMQVAGKKLVQYALRCWKGNCWDNAPPECFFKSERSHISDLPPERLPETRYWITSPATTDIDDIQHSF